MRSMLLEVVRAAPSVIVSAVRAADDALDVGDRHRAGRRAERQLVAAVAEIDGGLRQLGRNRDDVGTRAADQGLDVGDRAGVGRVGKRQLVVAGAEVDALRAP